jgi:hypothetical protein
VDVKDEISQHMCPNLKTGRLQNPSEIIILYVQKQHIFVFGDTDSIA